MGEYTWAMESDERCKDLQGQSAKASTATRVVQRAKDSSSCQARRSLKIHAQKMSHQEDKLSWSLQKQANYGTIVHSNIRIVRIQRDKRLLRAPSQRAPALKPNTCSTQAWIELDLSPTKARQP